MFNRCVASTLIFLSALAGPNSHLAASAPLDPVYVLLIDKITGDVPVTLTLP